MTEPSIYDLRTFSKAELIHRRGGVCEICHERPATDLHHCLFHRDKHRPQLNHEFNYECLCHECHMEGKGDTYDHRCAFYIRQVERYGFALDEWLEEEIKPLYKIKRFDFVGAHLKREVSTKVNRTRVRILV